jgi:hypothetical protein
MNEEITIKEALQEGYTLCGKPNESWQCLLSIKDLNPIDIEEGLFLANKKCIVETFSNERITEILADIVSDSVCSETGRDDDDIYNSIKKLDFTNVEKKIQGVLDKFPTYKLTNIKLINP